MGKSLQIGAALEQYDDLFIDDSYDVDYKTIKSMIDRISKPGNGPYGPIKTKSKINLDPNDMDLTLNSLEEDRSYHGWDKKEQQHQNNATKKILSPSNANYQQQYIQFQATQQQQQMLQHQYPPPQTPPPNNNQYQNQPQQQYHF